MEAANNYYDIVTFKNPDINSIEVIYDKHSYGVVEPGAVRKFPFFIAEHACKHLTDQILNRLDIRTDNQDERVKLRNQIIVEIEASAPKAVVSESDRWAAEVERLNKVNQQQQSTLNPILAKEKETTEQPTPEDTALPVEEVVTPPVPSGVDTPSNGESTIVAPQQIPTQQHAETNGVTRDVLYNYAINTLKMDLEDKKTKESLDKMDVEQLKQDLNYEDPTNL